MFPIVALMPTCASWPWICSAIESSTLGAVRVIFRPFEYPASASSCLARVGLYGYSLASFEL